MVLQAPIIGASAKSNINIIYFWTSKIHFLICENIYTNYIKKIVLTYLLIFRKKNHQ